MIFVTGDCHGRFYKLGSKTFKEQKEMTKDDLVIICDFGDDENDANASKPHGFADGYGLDDPLDDFADPYSAFGYM